MIQSKLWLVLDGSWVLSAHVQQDLYQVFVFTTTKHHWPVFWPPQDVRLDISSQRARHKHSTFILDNLATSAWKPWNNTHRSSYVISFTLLYISHSSTTFCLVTFSQNSHKITKIYDFSSTEKQLPPFLVTLRWEFLTSKQIDSESTLELPWLCTATVARLF